MKKIYYFLSVTLILFSVFACTIPSEIEITGSPSIKFAVDMDFGDFFSDMVGSTLNTGDNEVKVLDCTDSSLEYKTYLLYIDAFTDEDFECEMDESKFASVGMEDFVYINGNEIKLRVVSGSSGNQLEVVYDSDITSPTVEPYTISSSGFGDYLEGFEFTGLESKMYISGTDLVKALDIELYYIDGGGIEFPISTNTPVMKESGVESLEEYPESELPEGGELIEIDKIINSKEDLSISYRIFLKAGKIIDFDWLKGKQVINIEVVIWLPMTFESKEENAQFNFQGFFDGIGDVLKSISGAGFIEKISIKININPSNPFNDGIFYIKDDSYSINTPMDDNSFSFDLGKEDVEYINNNSFNPNFLILYPEKDSFLGIPNEDIMITTISLDAELKYNVEIK